MTDTKSKKSFKRKKHKVSNRANANSFVGQSTVKTDDIIDFEEYTKQDLMDANNFFAFFLKMLISLSWIGSFFSLSIFFAVGHIDNTLINWIFVLLSVMSILLSPLFFKKGKNLWKSAIVPLVCSIPVLSVKWSIYMLVAVVVNMMFLHLIFFLNGTRAKRTDTVDVLKFKINALFIIVIVIFAILHLMGRI